VNFPNRRDNCKPNATEALRSAGPPSHSFAISQHSKRSTSPDLLMHQDLPDTDEVIKIYLKIQKETCISRSRIYSMWRSRIVIVAAVCDWMK
jgi:small subunit ribosomal protein S36